MAKTIKTEYAIIGNSAAGIGCVEGIRSVDAKGTITLISDEKYHTYSRPLITYYLGKKVVPDNMYYRPKNFYKTHGVNTLLGVTVIKIDAAKKELQLSDGNKVAYGKLLVGTGGAPFVPPIKGSDGPGVYTFTKWDEAKQVAKVADENTKAVIIGGGLIGMKSAEGLMELDSNVTIVELADRVLSAILDETGSKMFEDHLESLGARLVTGDTVTEIVRDGEKVTGVILKSGKKLACDMVIVAIGVVPNTALAKDAGVKTERGILVDEHLKTNKKDIYAAGDCVETYDVLRHIRRPQPIWPNAYIQGREAGKNMAGKKTAYAGGFGMNSVEVKGLPTITVGMYDADGKDYEVIKAGGRKEGAYKKIILKNDKIVGAIFVGDIDRAGIITGLIRDGVKVTAFKSSLIGNGFGYAVFPKEMRKEKLAR